MRLISRLFSAALLVALSTGLGALAQESDSRLHGGYYKFDKGAPAVNSLWSIAGEDWRVVYDDPQNASFREHWRWSMRGSRVYVFTQFGERVHVPAGVYSFVKLELEPEAKIAPAPPPPPPATKLSIVNLWWIPLGIAVTLFGWWFFMSLLRSGPRSAEAELKRVTTESAAREQAELDAEEARLADPIGSGPPVISGGIGPQLGTNELRTAENRIIGSATTFFGGTQSNYRVIGNVRRVRITGIGLIEYGDKSVLEKRLEREPAYEALVEDKETGERIFFYAVWICANGAISHRYKGEFTVEPFEEGVDNIVRLVALASATEVARYGDSVYDPRYDRQAIIAGHMGTRVGQLANATVEAVSDDGKQHWHSGPLSRSKAA